MMSEDEQRKGGDPTSLSKQTLESGRPLTRKQRVFVEFYLQTWNAKRWYSIRHCRTDERAGNGHR